MYLTTFLLLVFIVFSESLLVFDTTQKQSQQSLQCLQREGYAMAAFRVFGDGKPDQTGVENMKTAIKVYEILDLVLGYLSPKPLNQSSGEQQVKDAIDKLKENGISIVQLKNGIFYHVVVADNWSKNKTYNREFLKSLISGGSEMGLKTYGIFSSKHSWNQIMGSQYNIANDGQFPLLWYSHPDKQQNNKDWQSGKAAFGKWHSPIAKQFEQNVEICDTIINCSVIGVF